MTELAFLDQPREPLYDPSLGAQDFFLNRGIRRELADLTASADIGGGALRVLGVEVSDHNAAWLAARGHDITVRRAEDEASETERFRAGLPDDLQGRLHVVDLTDIPDAAYDVAVVHGVSADADTLAGTIGEVFDELREDGRVSLLVPSRAGALNRQEGALANTLARINEIHRTWAGDTVFTPGELERAFKEAGGRVLDMVGIGFQLVTMLSGTLASKHLHEPAEQEALTQLETELGRGPHTFEAGRYLHVHGTNTRL